MARPTLRYDKMVENALRSVVRQALTVAAEHGLPGAHHFYVTFRTDHPGVDMPDFLRAQYPQEMTIVLEHQFWGLEVDEVHFAVTLSFRNQTQRLVIPLAAITAFADPSVKFGLEFRAETSADDLPPEPAPTPEPPPPTAPSAEDDKPKAGEVVKLDLFRKK
jgi:hypothetical protein